MPKRLPITERHKTLLKAPTVASQLPINFSNGYKLLEWVGGCCECGKEIAEEDLHGTVSRPIEVVAVIEAVGVCHDCRLLTPFHCRVRNNLALEWINRNGRWVRSDGHGAQLLEEISTVEKGEKRVVNSLVLLWGVFMVFMLPMIACLIKFAYRR
jgi:hypothetical protein